MKIIIERSGDKIEIDAKAIDPKTDDLSFLAKIIGAIENYDSEITGLIRFPAEDKEKCFQ